MVSFSAYSDNDTHKVTMNAITVIIMAWRYAKSKSLAPMWLPTITAEAFAIPIKKLRENASIGVMIDKTISPSSLER